jgi:hypothetical protein
MSSNTTLIISLNNISIELNRYFGIFIFLFGCIGNILNILVLSKRTLRFNPCALLFLASSICNLIGILSGLSPRILAGWNMDPTNTRQWLCKLRVMIAFPSRSGAYWFIMLAAIDRWLSSSAHVNLRRMSTIKNAERGIIIIILFSIILYIQAPICYDIRSSNFLLQCYGQTINCRISMDMTYGFITIGLPIVVMIAFSFKTILNIRRTRNRIQAMPMVVMNPSNRNIQPRRHRWRAEQHLLLMLITQIILFTLLAFPVAIQRIYFTLTLNNVKSDLQNAIENFIYNFVILLSFLANGIPFYIYTLTGGKIFRKALFDVIHCN